MKAIYARQSVERPGSVSIETQLTICRTHIGEKIDMEEYVDSGASGKDMNRPALKRLLEEIEKKHIEAVYVYKLDRISRSLYDFSLLIRLFEQRGVRFVSCTECFDTRTPMGRAMLSMAATFAQLERETISQRVSDVYHEKALKGAYMGGRVPFGFKVEQHKYVPIPNEVAVLQYLFRSYLKEEQSYHSIALELEKRGIRSRTGKSFKPARIGEILRNPVYVKSSEAVYQYGRMCGYNIVNQGAEGNGFFQYHMEGNICWILAPHKGIIESDIWILAQLKRKKRFGEALRIAQEKLDAKNYYAFNPEIDK